MGFGKIHIFTYELANKCKNGEQIVIICGNNQKLKRTLKKQFWKNKDVHIIGYTEHVSDFMNACDVIYTKPGGLTSTEALVKNVPIVHTSPIPGCETKNLEFFTSRGMSVAAGTIHGQVRQGKLLMDNQSIRNGMIQSQRENAHPDAALRIVELLESVCVS